MKRLYREAPLELYRRRIDLIMVACILTGLGLVARLAYLQLAEGPALKAASTRNFLRTVVLPAQRGTIYDRDGEILAHDQPNFEVYVTPADVPDINDLIERLRPILSLDELAWFQMNEKLSRPKGMERHRAIKVASDLTRQQVAQLESMRSEQGGVSIRIRYQRVYPHKTVGAHLLGYLGKPTAAELRADSAQKYRPDSMRGRYGLERRFESQLAGQDGFARFVVNARGGREMGQWVSTAMANMVNRRSARRGDDLVLTVDATVQSVLLKAMGGHQSGAAVVMDVENGDILGLVSKPGFDPNNWSGRLTRKAKEAIDANPYHPMLDKSVHAYFPGSVYKIVTAFAGIESGILDPFKRISSPGAYEFGKRLFHCHKRSGHGRINLAHALAASADVYFYKIGEELGIDTLAQYARRFGFGNRAGLSINGESAGTVPTRAHHEARTKGGFQYGLSLSTAVGQGDVRATPVQVAIAYAALANGGRILKPRIADRIQDHHGQMLNRFPSLELSEVGGSPSTIKRINEGLKQAVHHKKIGTALKAAPNRGAIAGKTGTAQVRNIVRGRHRQAVKQFRHRDHAWFAGFAPAEQPKIVVVVFLEHGGSGGKQAAPVARRIIERYDSLIEPIFSDRKRASRSKGSGSRAR